MSRRQRTYHCVYPTPTSGESKERVARPTRIGSRRRRRRALNLTLEKVRALEGSDLRSKVGGNRFTERKESGLESLLAEDCPASIEAHPCVTGAES